MTNHPQDEETEALPREQMLDLQTRYLERHVRALAGSSGFYMRKLEGMDVTDVTALRRFPMTSRDDVLAAQREEPPWGGLLAVPLSSVSIIGFSSAKVEVV